MVLLPFLMLNQVLNHKQKLYGVKRLNTVFHVSFLLTKWTKSVRVAAGDVVGKVAKPTIYYTQEGTNVYYKLTKDGVPIDPLKRPASQAE